MLQIRENTSWKEVEAPEERSLLGAEERSLSGAVVGVRNKVIEGFRWVGIGVKVLPPLWLTLEQDQPVRKKWLFVPGARVVWCGWHRC